jgi:hypothetical protein
MRSSLFNVVTGGLAAGYLVLRSVLFLARESGQKSTLLRSEWCSM